MTQQEELIYHRELIAQNIKSIELINKSLDKVWDCIKRQSEINDEVKELLK
jgi:hypothetical protein